MVAIPVHHHSQNQRGEADSLDNGDQGIVAEIAHYGAVHTETDKQRDGNQGGADKQPHMQLDRVDHIVNPEAHDKCKP